MKPAIDNLEKEGFWLTIRAGLLKGMFYTTASALLLSHREPLIPVPIIAILVLAIAVFLQYHWIYRKNIENHRIMIKRFGDDYVRDLETALDEMGLGRMFEKSWFIKRYKEHWDI